MIKAMTGFFGGNGGSKVVSIIVAVVLWVVVLGSRSVEVSKEIPVAINLPENLVVANEVPEKVVFRLAGPKAFLRAILDRPEEPIRVNLSGARPGVVTYRFFADNIRLPIGVRVLQVTPPSIPFRLETVRTRDVAVRPETSGEVPEGYALKRIVAEPKTVRVRGAESRVSALTELPTQPIDLTSLRGDLETEARFDLDRAGVRLEGKPPRILAQVAALQANFKIRVRSAEVRVDSPHRARVDDVLITVYVRAEPGEISKLDSSSVTLGIDLRGKAKGRYTSKLKVGLPPDVGMVRVVPEDVRVTLF